MLAKHKTPLAWIAIACCCLLAAWSATHRLQQSMPRAGTWDFPIFVSYANQFLATGMIYDRNLTQYVPGAAIYKFPPLSGSILVSALQTGFTENALMALGASLQLAAFSGGILLLTLVLLPSKRIEACTLAVCMASALLPLLEENLLRLQLEPAIFFLSAIAAICIYKDKYFMAGCFIGLAAALKIYPAVALFFFIASRKWSALYGFIAGFLLACAFTLVTIGYAEHEFYVSRILPIMLQENPADDVENISSASILGMAGLNLTQIKLATPIILVTLLTLSLLPLAATAKTCSDGARKKMQVLIFSMFIPCVLLGMNNSWWNYQILLSLPFTVIACFLLHDSLTPGKKVDILSVAGLLFMLASLHVTASLTVEDQFYSTPLINMIIAIVIRILTPALLFLIFLRTVRINTH